MLVKHLPKRIMTSALLLLMVAVGAPCLATPAQQEIAFVRGAEEGTSEIYGMHGNGDEQTNLTRSGGINTSPRWSPDGSHILFLRELEGGRTDIFSMRANGDEQTNLTRDPATDHQPRWSPDGANIVFVRKAAGDNHDIWTMDTDGGNQQQLTRTEGRDWYPAWSPDSRWIVFQSFRDGAPQLWKVRSNGDLPTQLTNDANGAGDAEWSPDGEWIVYAAARAADLELWKMRADGTDQTQLTHAQGIDRDPHWSPDGRFIVFLSERDGNGEIYCMSADGEAQTNLTLNPASDGEPTWSDDGAHVLFSSDRDGNLEIYTIGADGSDLRRLTHSGAGECQAVFGPRPTLPVTPVAETPVGPGTICFQRTVQFDQVSQIRLMDPDGSNMRVLPIPTTTNWLEDPAFRRDAARIVYVEKDPVTGASRLCHCTRDGTLPELITGMVGLFDDPMWHPEGNRILFRYRPSADADWRAATYAWINLDGTGLQELAIDGYDVALSADGQRIAVVRVPNLREFRTDIWLADQYGNNAGQLTMSVAEAPVVDHGPAWSPDGTTIAFFRSRDPHLGEDLCLVPVTGAQPTVILQNLKPVRDTHVVWSPDGKELLFASGHEDSYSLYVVTLGPPAHRVRRLTDAAGLDYESDWR